MALGTEKGGCLSSESWTVLIRTVTGIADLFLGESRDQGQAAEQLAAPLAECVFSLFLNSGTQNPAVYDVLCRLAAGWTHRELVISAWSAVATGLTKKLLYVLYGTQYDYLVKMLVKGEKPELDRPVESFVVVQFSDGPRVRIYNMSDAQILYAWYRVTLLFEWSRVICGESTKPVFPDPRLYMKYVRLLADILEEFATVAKVRREKGPEIIVEAADIIRAKQVPAGSAQNTTFSVEFSSL